MATYDDVIKIHEELEAVNNEIIKRQQEEIKLLRAHNNELKELIQKYLLKNINK
jgi:hypothetical protein